MLEGIMMFYSENVWSSQFNKPTKRCVHWIIQVAGSSLALSGIFVKYINNSGQHFKTTHSTIGLISAIFLLISLCSGVVALKSFSLRNIVRPALVKFLHYLAGSMAILLGSWNGHLLRFKVLLIFLPLGLVALCYGYDKKFMQANSDEQIRLWLQLIAGSTALFSLIGALQSFYLAARSVLRTIWNNYNNIMQSVISKATFTHGYVAVSREESSFRCCGKSDRIQNCRFTSIPTPGIMADVRRWWLVEVKVDLRNKNWIEIRVCLVWKIHLVGSKSNFACSTIDRLFAKAGEWLAYYKQSRVQFECLEKWTH